MDPRSLPVAIVGAGPIGLAAAARLIDRGLRTKIYEAGETVGTAVRAWGHVRLFSPWEYNVDGAARSLLERHGWKAPEDETYPIGTEFADLYLDPLAATPEMAGVIETGARVSGIGRQGIDKVVTRGRQDRPFVLEVVGRDGRKRRELASAVIDASGTWTTPNPLGAGGLPADGERTFADRIAYGVPDVTGGERDDYVGRTTLVVGAGHSAANVILDLHRLADADPATTIVWATRGTDLARVFGGGGDDKLAARGELGAALRGLVDRGRVTLVTGFAVTSIREERGRLLVEGETRDGPRSLGPLDRIVATTGQRPDLGLTRELRLDLDPWLESARALGPLIDPNLHSCGSVPPHGHRELSHPEPGFYTVGIKSYGRAPTFLMLTGYEQVRSVAAAIAGDLIEADDVHLVLPETGVCSAPRIPGGAPVACCGGPAPSGVDACCARDAEAKAFTGEGCGCVAPAIPTIAAGASCCDRAA